MLTTTQSITPTPWEALKNFTDARIALGRAGVSMPTAAHLAFQLAHAQARDAVHLTLDTLGVATSLQDLGLSTLLLHSQAPDRAAYLQRPDWGRRLDAPSHQAIAHWREAAQGQAPLPLRLQAQSDATTQTATPVFDLALVVADGLSALAIHQNAAPLIAKLLQHLTADTAQTWSIAPVAVVEQARVAIGDEIGVALKAQAVVVLIGERPGLSSPDSLGIYLTWSPQIGTTDAQRNCISNVRPAGLSIDAAAHTLYRLLSQARLQQRSGLQLKMDVALIEQRKE